jgi:hypothetical protein
VKEYDGLGRNIKSQSVDSSGDVFVESQFDAFGRPWKTSNPYRVNETPVWTTNVYDEASRIKEIITPDRNGRYGYRSGVKTKKIDHECVRSTKTGGRTDGYGRFGSGLKPESAD